jgi:hypothetical protein
MAATVRMLAAAVLALLVGAGGGALAEKPEQAGKGRGKAERPAREAAGPSVTIRFPAEARAVVRDYYQVSIARQGCPPGLAKKNNGCLPPGQAKKWAIGRPLPREAIWHELPPELVVKIGLPPRGYKYVRAAADILLIAVGTGLVVDAIEDLGRL